MDLNELTAALNSDATALIRADRGNAAAWPAILEAISTPVDTTGKGTPTSSRLPTSSRSTTPPSKG